MHTSINQVPKRLIFLIAVAFSIPHGSAQTQFVYTINNNTITITGHGSIVNAVTIPSTILVNGVNLPVTSIGAGAFQNTGITSVTIPNSVTSIGIAAFRACPSLTSVTIPNSITSIADYTFANCTGLNSVTIPLSVTSIGNYSFESCISLASVTIPVSVISIGTNAFEGSGLTKISIPISVTSIGNYTFASCTSLASVTIPISVTSIGNEAFFKCRALTSVTIPNSVTSIGDEAFFNCFALAEVTIPSSVANIGNEVFYNCNDLTNVTIPGSVTSMGEEVFGACFSLSNVTIGNGITSIAASTFVLCPKLTSVTIPNSVSSIGANAFEACANLISVYFTGSAPSADSTVFAADNNVTVYYLPDTSGWGSTFAGVSTVIFLNQPIISTFPVSLVVVTGTNASFSLAINSTLPPTYQWQLSTDGGNSWNSINGDAYTGVNSSNLTVTNATTTQLGYQFKAVITNSAGTITTAPVTLVVGTSNSQINWLFSYFSSEQLGEPAIVSGLSTPANDGIPNLLKYAFNLNPLVDGHSFLPQPTVSNGNLTLSVQSPQSDIIYTIQASTDLINWSTGGVTQINDTTNSTVTGSSAISTNTPVFLRIAVAPSQ